MTDLTGIESLLVYLAFMETIRFIFMVYAKFKPFFCSRDKSKPVRQPDERKE